MENRALRLREVATAMQQYQDDVLPSTSSIQFSSSSVRQHGVLAAAPEQHNYGGGGTAQNSNRLHTNIHITSSGGEGDDPGGKEVNVVHGSAQGFRSRVGGLKLESNNALVAPSGHSGGDWEYFDEAGYIRGGALRTGEDPYIRNRFNQEASDTLPSNRDIPDTRHPM